MAQEQKISKKSQTKQKQDSVAVESVQKPKSKSGKRKKTADDAEIAENKQIDSTELDNGENEDETKDEETIMKEISNQIRAAKQQKRAKLDSTSTTTTKQETQTKTTKSKKTNSVSVPDTAKKTDAKAKHSDDIDAIFAGLKQAKTDKTEKTKAKTQQQQTQKTQKQKPPEDDMGFTRDSKGKQGAGNTGTRYTSDGLRIYTTEELGIGVKTKSKNGYPAGEGPDCPIDCDCCF